MASMLTEFKDGKMIVTLDGSSISHRLMAAKSILDNLQNDLEDIKFEDQTGEIQTVLEYLHDEVPAAAEVIDVLSEYVDDSELESEQHKFFCRKNMDNVKGYE